MKSITINFTIWTNYFINDYIILRLKVSKSLAYLSNVISVVIEEKINSLSRKQNIEMVK